MDRVTVQASELTIRTNMELGWDKTRQQSLSIDFDNIDTGFETLFIPSNNTYKWQLPAGFHYGISAKCEEDGKRVQVIFIYKEYFHSWQNRFWLWYLFTNYSSSKEICWS